MQISHEHELLSSELGLDHMRHHMRGTRSCLSFNNLLRLVLSSKEELQGMQRFQVWPSKLWKLWNKKEFPFFFKTHYNRQSKVGGLWIVTGKRMSKEEAIEGKFRVLLQQPGPPSLASSYNNRKVEKSFFPGKKLSFFWVCFCSIFFLNNNLGGLFGLLLPRGFGCSLFFNGSLFASLVNSKYPPPVFIVLAFTL